MTTSVVFTTLGCVLLATCALKHFISSKSSHLPFPPGPPGLPLLKNLLDWSMSRQWITYDKWSKLYGNIVYVSVVGQNIVVINSYEAAVDLLQQRGALYSGRPSLYFASQMVGFGQLVSSMAEAGPVWKAHRRILAQHIGSNAMVRHFQPAIEMQTRRFLRRVMEDPRPEMLHCYIHTLAGAIILDITYGYKVSDENDPFITLAKKVVENGSKSSRPGAYLVDFIQSIEHLPSWLPGTAFKREAADMRADLMNFVNQPYEYTRAHMAMEEAQHSFVASHLQQGDISAEEEENLKWAAAVMYAGGADTTVSVIYAFILLMTLHPEIQSKAQDEIDCVIGPDRLPALSDRSQLPFVCALIQEVFRWGIVFPQAIPRVSAEDDVYNGYYIPRGSIIIPNVWGISRDPQVYKSPELFDPSRFLGESLELDPKSYIFGFGRRICAGHLLADSNVFLACSMILATIKISKAVSASGEEITPSFEIEGELLTRPKDFICELRARSTRVAALLEDERLA